MLSIDLSCSRKPKENDMNKLIFSVVVLAFFSLHATSQTNTDILPQNTRDYIDQHFNSATIIKVEKEDGWFNWDSNEMYEVKLDNGVKLEFDRDGNVTEIDSERDQAIPMEALPDRIQQYLNDTYNGIEVVSYDVGRREQDVELANGIDRGFEAKGNFKRID